MSIMVYRLLPLVFVFYFPPNCKFTSPVLNPIADLEEERNLASLSFSSLHPLFSSFFSLSLL